MRERVFSRGIDDPVLRSAKFGVRMQFGIGMPQNLVEYDTILE